MDSLWGAPEDGDGSAALTSTWRPHRGISRKLINLVVAALGAAILGGFAAQIVFTEPPARRATASAQDHYVLQVSPTPTTSSAVPSPTAPKEKRRVSYAMALYDLAGLPPDAPIQTPLELWVAWDHRVSRNPQVQPLVSDVRIERYVQPTTPDGPRVVMLSVPRSQLDELLYGDRYGSLSAVVTSS